MSSKSNLSTFSNILKTLNLTILSKNQIIILISIYSIIWLDIILLKWLVLSNLSIIIDNISLYFLTVSLHYNIFIYDIKILYKFNIDFLLKYNNLS